MGDVEVMVVREEARERAGTKEGGGDGMAASVVADGL